MRGGCKQNEWGEGVQTPRHPFSTRCFRSVLFVLDRTRPSRASGEGEYGSDPPFLTADAVSRGGGCKHGCKHPCKQSPPSPWGSLPSYLSLREGSSRPLAAGTTPNGAHVRLTSKPRPAVVPVFVGNREELSPLTPGRKVPFRP